VLDLFAFAIAFCVSGCHGGWRKVRALVLFSLTFGPYNGYFMRGVRIYAYMEELLFLASYRDSYVPKRVLNISSMY
jgi:hypothetical protein